MMDLTEQIYVQVSLSVCRIIMIVLMVYTIIDSEINNTNTFSNFDYNHSSSSISSTTASSSCSGSNSSNSNSSSSSNWFRVSKLHVMLPIAAFANIFHHAIPGLAQPITDKTKVKKVFHITLVVCYISYTFIGCVISRYFGRYTCASANLNWKNYIGNDNDIDDNSSSIIVKAIVCFIVLFPAIDVSSAFPLNAVTLGDSLMSSFYGSKVHDIENIKSFKILFRLFASVPPIVASSLNLHLGTITDFTGLAGFAIAFIFPSLLAYSSEHFFRKKNMNPYTYYSDWTTRSTVVLVTLVFGIVLVCYVIASFLIFGAH